MTMRHQRLELNWIGKENRPKLEPRILLEDPAKSYDAPHRVTDLDLFDNRLIVVTIFSPSRRSNRNLLGKSDALLSIRPITPVLHLNTMTMASNTLFGCPFFASALTF